MNQKSERLNKVLAHQGYGSRRTIDALIAAGKITVNNQAAQVGQKVTPRDVILIGGHNVTRETKEKIVMAFHKPKGVTTTKKDPFAKTTVVDFLPQKLHYLNPIGRLDKDSRGLLLLTNDGDLKLHLEHPSFGHEKEYEVHVASYKKISPNQFKEDIATLATRIVNPNVQTQPVIILKSNFDPKRNTGSVSLVLREGKKRQIRELFRTLGYTVTDLLRTRINAVTLDNLKEGEYRLIDKSKIIL